MKQKLYTQQEKVSRIYYFSPYFGLFRTIDIFPIQTFIITLSRNVMLTMPRELGLPLRSGFLISCFTCVCKRDQKVPDLVALIFCRLYIRDKRNKESAETLLQTLWHLFKAQVNLISI